MRKDTDIALESVMTSGYNLTKAMQMALSVINIVEVLFERNCFSVISSDTEFCADQEFFEEYDSAVKFLEDQGYIPDLKYVTEIEDFRRRVR